MSTPLVTLAIPTYKRADLLRVAIRSALAQTYSPLEVLVLDDASPDQTPDVVAEFSADPRLRHIRHKTNLGIVGNWRYAFDNAAGEFMAILHDDDTFLPSFVTALIQPLLADESVGMAFCDQTVVDAEGKPSEAATCEADAFYKRDILPPGRLTDFARTSLIDGSVPVGAALYRTALLRAAKLPNEAAGQVDFWLFYQLARQGIHAVYVKEQLATYRRHEGSMSGSMQEYCWLGGVYRCQKILADPALTEISPGIRRQLSGYYSSLSSQYAVSGKYGPAVSNAFGALRFGPSPRTLAKAGLAMLGPLGRGALRR